MSGLAKSFLGGSDSSDGPIGGVAGDLHGAVKNLGDKLKGLLG